MWNPGAEVRPSARGEENPHACILIRLHDFGLFALLTVFALLTTSATIAQVRWRGRWQRTLLLAAAGVLSAAVWAGYEFGAPDRLELIDHFATIGLAIIVASSMSWFVAQRIKQQSADSASGARFQALAEAIPQIVWIADGNGRTTYINERWYEMTGTQQGGEVGIGWMESVHADDRAAMNEKWQQCRRSGETFEFEYRLHDAVRGYRWYLDRAVPLRDDRGAVQQWFGTCTDIEEQKHYQQILEQQIKERTEELADTNTRLQQEMWEKDLARRTLDEHNEEMMQALKERSQRAPPCLPRWASCCKAATLARKCLPQRSAMLPRYSRLAAEP